LELVCLEVEGSVENGALVLEPGRGREGGREGREGREVQCNATK